MSGIPEIRTDRGIPTLYVKDVPFFALSGKYIIPVQRAFRIWRRRCGPGLQE